VLRTEDNSVRPKTPAGTGGMLKKGSFCKYSPAKSSENGQEAVDQNDFPPGIVMLFFR
jgi:hypothetical protein